MILRLHNIVETAVNPALALLPKHMDSPNARVMLLSVGLQESKFEHRYQLTKKTGVKGPARGFWQFEKGGVRGVWKHRASMELLRLLCRARDCAFDPVPIWERIEFDDVLAAGLARLLLWTDAFPLPKPDQPEVAWRYYLRTWNPGKPKPKTWAGYHSLAVDYVSKAEVV